MKKQNNKMKYFLLVTMLFVGTALGQDLSQTRQKSETGGSVETGIFLVRHGERDRGLNPPLNKNGKKRAVALASVFADSGITAIYCPDLIRNRQTAQLLAERLGLDIQVLPDSLTKDSSVLTDYFMNTILPENEGGVILFVGNQKSDIMTQYGTFQALYIRLGGKGIPLTRYCDVYHIIRKNNKTIRVIHSVYGNKNIY